MRTLRTAAACLLAVVAALSLSAGLIAPHDYSQQHREHADEPPSPAFPLGTDGLGRDRLSRLLYAGRVSLLFAPAAAMAATLLGAMVGIAAGFWGGWLDEIARTVIDLFLSLPWLFVLIALRALLPLNISPWASLAATFTLLAAVGWASGARVVRAAVAGLRVSPHVLHARACGCGPLRLLVHQVLPDLRPVLTAQFWILAPVFLLTEANLGVLGLGIAEPLPSWGNMLAELQNYDRVAEAPWILAPALMVVLVVASLHFLVSRSAVWE